MDDGGRVRDRSASGFLSGLVAGLALGGGMVMLCAAVLVCASVVMRWLTSQSIPGDFEIVQISVALAAFAFFPYCQLQRSNIVVGTFTSRLSVRGLAWLEALWDCIYAAVAGFLAWRLSVGAAETIANRTTTMVSGIPIGWAIAAVAVMAGILSLTALLTAVDRLRRRA